MSDISLSLMGLVGLVYYIHQTSNMNPRWWQWVYPGVFPPWTHRGIGRDSSRKAKDYYRDLSLASDDKWRLFDAEMELVGFIDLRVPTSPVEDSGRNREAGTWRLSSRHFQQTYPAYKILYKYRMALALLKDCEQLTCWYSEACLRPSINISSESCRGNVSIPLLAVAARDAFASKKTETGGLEGRHLLNCLELYLYLYLYYRTKQ